jgi:hypothetical protein
LVFVTIHREHGLPRARFCVGAERKNAEECVDLAHDRQVILTKFDGQGRVRAREPMSLAVVQAEVEATNAFGQAGQPVSECGAIGRIFDSHDMLSPEDSGCGQSRPGVVSARVGSLHYIGRP